MDYQMRAATPDDHDLIYTRKSQSIRPYVEKIWGWDESYQQKEFDRDFSQIEQFQIIETNGQFIGFVQCNLEQSCCHVVEIHLLPAYQGKGIGTGVLKSLQETCVLQGIRVHIGCFKENGRAKKLYERLGFIQTEETETHYILEYVK